MSHVTFLTLLISIGSNRRVCSQPQTKVCSKRKGEDISVMPIAEGASCILGSISAPDVFGFDWHWSMRKHLNFFFCSA